MEQELKCVAKIHDIGFRADAKREVKDSKGSVHTQHYRVGIELMLRDTGVRRVTDAKIDKVCYFYDIQTKNGIFGMFKSSLGFFGKKSKKQNGPGL